MNSGFKYAHLQRKITLVFKNAYKWTALHYKTKSFLNRLKAFSGILVFFLSWMITNTASNHKGVGLASSCSLTLLKLK